MRLPCSGSTEPQHRDAMRLPWQPPNGSTGACCHAADCHGSTEACNCQHRGRSRLPCHGSTDTWQHRGRNATAMAAAARRMAAPRPQCDCHAADCHGSTEAAMRLPWQQPRADSGTEAAMRLHCHAADCHGSTEAAMRLPANCHAANCHSSTEATMRLPCSQCHGSTRPMQLPCSRYHSSTEPALATEAAMRPPWQQPRADSASRPQYDCHAADRHGSTEAAMRLAAPRRNAIVMQPTAMAAPAQCDCHGNRARRMLFRPQCDCHAADCHGSTEAAMRLPAPRPQCDCHAATAMAAPRPQCDCTAMQPTAMAAPRPQCDCTVMQPTAMAPRPMLPCHAADCHGSTSIWQHRGRNATAMLAAEWQHRPQCDCHAADCHGSTEAAMRLPAPAAMRLSCSRLPWQHRGPPATAMQPAAIALPAQPTVSHTDEPRADEQRLPLRHCPRPSRCHSTDEPTASPTDDSHCGPRASVRGGGPAPPQAPAIAIGYRASKQASSKQQLEQAASSQLAQWPLQAQAARQTAAKARRGVRVREHGN